MLSEVTLFDYNLNFPPNTEAVSADATADFGVVTQQPLGKFVPSNSIASESILEDPEEELSSNNSEVSEGTLIYIPEGTQSDTEVDYSYETGSTQHPENQQHGRISLPLQLMRLKIHEEEDREAEINNNDAQNSIENSSAAVSGESVSYSRNNSVAR